MFTAPKAWKKCRPWKLEGMMINRGEFCGCEVGKSFNCQLPDCWEFIFVTFLKCKLRYLGFFYTVIFTSRLLKSLSAAFNLVEVLKFKLGCSTGQLEGKAFD